MGNSYRLKSAQVILPLRVCSRWSHIPHRLQRCFAKGYKKTVRANSTVSLHPFAEREAPEPVLSQNIMKSQMSINNQLITIIIKSKYY